MALTPLTRFSIGLLSHNTQTPEPQASFTFDNPDGKSGEGQFECTDLFCACTFNIFPDCIS